MLLPSGHSTPRSDQLQHGSVAALHQYGVNSVHQLTGLHALTFTLCKRYQSSAVVTGERTVLTVVLVTEVMCSHHAAALIRFLAVGSQLQQLLGGISLSHHHFPVHVCVLCFVFCVFVFAHVYVHACVYVCMCMHACVYVYVHACVCVCVCVNE
jgi:hypothetical protein